MARCVHRDRRAELADGDGPPTDRSVAAAGGRRQSRRRARVEAPAVGERLGRRGGHQLRGRRGECGDLARCTRLLRHRELASATAPSEQPVFAESHLVREDPGVPVRRGAWRRRAASVSFPSRRSLATRIGTTLDDIHRPVPGGGAQVARPTSAFFDRPRPDPSGDGTGRSSTIPHCTNRRWFEGPRGPQSMVRSRRAPDPPTAKAHGRDRLADPRRRRLGPTAGRPVRGPRVAAALPGRDRRPDAGALGLVRRGRPWRSALIER